MHSWPPGRSTRPISLTAAYECVFGFTNELDVGS
jgi:hypothetical protein